MRYSSIVFAFTTWIIFGCNPRVTFPNMAVFSTVAPLMRDDTTRTGFFTNASLFDTTYKLIAYETTRGRVIEPNDGTQNFFLCRYDTATMQPAWVAVARGAGGDGGCNYYAVPPEGAVYVAGYFEDTAYFMHQAGALACDTLVSHGYADLFVAKYDYETGELQWVSSGGSRYADVVFMYGSLRHQEVYLAVDSVALTVCTNCFGPAVFGDITITCKTGGEAVCIRYDKDTGKPLSAGHPLKLPKIDAQ